MRILFATLVFLGSITFFGPRAAAELLGPIGVYLAIGASFVVPFLTRDPPRSSLSGEPGHAVDE